MLRTTLHRIIRIVAWCTVATVVTATAPSFAQGSDSPWTSAQAPSGATEVSARSEIAAPQGSGFAILKILYKAGKPAVIVYLIVESPQRLPIFPFDKYDGPVDKTQEEFIKFEVTSEKQGSARSVKVVAPNGYYGVTPRDAFVFDIVDKSVVSFLSHIRDEQRLTVTVNGTPSSLRVSFDTTGLKKLLDQMSLKTGGHTPARLPH